MPNELEENLDHAFFIVNAYPLNEVEAIMPISILLQHMALHILVDFRAALDLYAHCEQQYIRALAQEDQSSARSFARQAYVPARDGAMTIYHIGIALEQIRGRIGKCPALLQRVFTDELKIAQHQFVSHFSHYRNLRHGVSHLSEELSEITVAALRSGTSPFPDIRNRRFRAMWKKTEYSYSLTHETRKHLEAVLTLVCKAFRKVDDDSIAALKEGCRLSAEL